MMTLLRNLARMAATSHKQAMSTTKSRPMHILKKAIQSGSTDINVLSESIQYLVPKKNNVPSQLQPYREPILQSLVMKIKQLNRTQLTSLIRYLTMLEDQRYSTILNKAFTAFRNQIPIQTWNSFQFFYYWKAGIMLYKWKRGSRYILHLCIEAAQQLIHKINFNSIFSILTLMDQVMDFQMKTSERPKHRKLVQSIEQRTMKALQNENQLPTVEQKVLNAPHFYMILVKMGFLTNHKNDKLYEMIEDRAIQMTRSSKSSEPFKTLLIFSNQLLGFGVGTLKLVDEIYKCYTTNPAFRKSIQNYDCNYLGRLSSRYCFYQSCKMFQKFVWDKNQDGIMVLRKSKNKIEKIPVHPLIKVLESLSKPDDYYTHVQVLMPEIFKQKSHKKTVDSISNVDNNDFRSVVKAQLNQLKIPIAQEETVAARRADFIVNNEYIVEVDGDFHFDPATREDNPYTKLRNFMFLTAGYRVLVFRLPDYHSARRQDKVKQYIQQRLNLMRDPDVILAM